VKPHRMIFSDVGLFGLAVMFAWAIWYTVREDLNETQRRQIQLVVEAEGDLDVTPRTQAISVTVQGTRRAVDAVRSMASPRVVHRLTAADLPPGTDETRHDFGKDDLDFAEAFGSEALTVIDMQPQTVSVKLFRVMVQPVSVHPPEFAGAAELGLKLQVTKYTNEAKVRGPVSVLRNYREIRTVVERRQLAAIAEGLRDSPKTIVRLPLSIHPSQRDLFTLEEPAELFAEVELSRLAEQEVTLPIAIYDTAGSGKRANRRLQFAELNKSHFLPGDPPRVRLALTGVPAALGSLPAAGLRAFVLADDLPEDRRNGDIPVHVADLPPGVALAKDYTVYVEEVR
jgi:hypothetical protein